MYYITIENKLNLYWQGKDLEFGGRPTAWKTASINEANKNLIGLQECCAHRLNIEERWHNGHSVEHENLSLVK